MVLKYTPDNPPDDPKDLGEWLGRELGRVADGITGDYEATHREPPKLRAGMVRYADGVDWDPGSGEGLYIYKSDNAWHLLG